MARRVRPRRRDERPDPAATADFYPRHANRARRHESLAPEDPSARHCPELLALACRRTTPVPCPASRQKGSMHAGSCMAESISAVDRSRKVRICRSNWTCSLWKLCIAGISPEREFCFHCFRLATIGTPVGRVSRAPVPCATLQLGLQQRRLTYMIGLSHS